MQEEKLQIPPFVDGNYDFFDQTNGGVQPRFERKDDGTMGGVGQKEENVTDANALFESKKSELDKKFERLFELKAREDQLSDELREVSDEYWKMKECYDREYKKLLHEWSKSYDYLG